MDSAAIREAVYALDTLGADGVKLAGNVPVRCPNLKVIVPHCGSFLPLALPRMKSILTAMVNQGYMSPIDWEDPDSNKHKNRSKGH